MNRPILPALALLLGCASLTLAQDTQPVSSITGQAPLDEPRFEFSLAFAQGLGTTSFDATSTFRQYVEDATLKSSYEVGKTAGFGFDVQYNFKKNIGIRVGAQTFARESEGTFDAKIPHPFFFSRPRTITGKQSGLGFDESAISVGIVFRGKSGKWRYSLDGGPAFFKVNATLADTVSIGEVFPYDTATFSGVSSSKKKVSPIGFSGGVEFGRELSTFAAVFVQGRLAQGSGDIELGGQNVSVKAGGAQARLGIRFLIGRKPSSN